MLQDYLDDGGQLDFGVEPEQDPGDDALDMPDIQDPGDGAFLVGQDIDDPEDPGDDALDMPDMQDIDDPEDPGDGVVFGGLDIDDPEDPGHGVVFGLHDGGQLDPEDPGDDDPDLEQGTLKFSYSYTVLYYTYFFSSTDNPYQAILHELSKKWLMIEVEHRVSKEASNEFWSTANKLFHEMYVAKGDLGKKIPQFPVLREKLYCKNTPEVRMDIAYQCKENGEITIAKDVTSAPVSRFPPCTYRKLYEIASVDVRIFLVL